MSARLPLSDFCLITTFNVSQLHLFSILKWISVLDCLQKSCPLLSTWLYCHNAKWLYECQPPGKLEGGQPNQQPERLFHDCLTVEGSWVHTSRRWLSQVTRSGRTHEVAPCAVRTGSWQTRASHTPRSAVWPQWLRLGRSTSWRSRRPSTWPRGLQWTLDTNCRDLPLLQKDSHCVIFISVLSCQIHCANSPFSEIRIEKSYQIMWTYRTFIFPVSESLYPLNQCSIDTVSLRNDWGNYWKSTQLIINQTLKMMLKKRKAWLNSCCPVSDESSSTCLSVWHRREIQGVYIEWMSAWIAEKIDGIWS